VRYISLFSGIEAATVAWKPLGWEPVAFAENEKFPSAVLENHYPEVPNLGDITQVDWSQYEGEADVVIGGSPCQSFSVAGLRNGLDDPRGNLALEFFQAVDRIKPRWVIWENVPGVLSSNGGRDFGSIVGALEKLGYGWAYRTLDAQYFGVAQRRRRVFLVGHLGSANPAAAVLFEPESLRGDSAPCREAGEGAAAGVIKGAAIGREPENGPQYGEWLTDGSCYTLNCAEQHAVAYGGNNTTGSIDVAYGLQTDATPKAAKEVSFTLKLPSASGGGQPAAVQHGMAVRRLTPRECERLQGFPDDFTAIPWRGKPADQCPDGHRYKALGNSMAVPVVKWIGERISEKQ
jgi:DNA (cytosine-5)-methyltransferase 1